MSRMQQIFANPAFTGPYQVQQVNGDVHSVVVTSFSNGHGTCTQTVTYTGNAAAPKVVVKRTGDASCGAMQAAPISSPGVRTPSLWHIDYPGTPPSAPRQG